MPVYLVQHGRSLTKEQDPDRPLTGEGRAIVARMARIASEHQVRVALIRHSGKTRARQTAEILADALAPAGGLQPWEGMGPTDDVTALAGALDPAEDILWVGHLPFLERLVSRLITGDDRRPVVKFQNGGIVCLDRDPEQASWRILWTLMPELR